MTTHLGRLLAHKRGAEGEILRETVKTHSCLLGTVTPLPRSIGGIGRVKKRLMVGGALSMKIIRSSTTGKRISGQKKVYKPEMT